MENLEKMETKIRNILFTLSGVKIEGPDNCRRMTGVFNTLEELQLDIARIKVELNAKTADK